MEKFNLLKSNELFVRKCKTFGILFIIVVLQSCGPTKYNFSTSPVVPAAEGFVKVKKDNNSNYSIDLHIKRMADPKRLSPAKEMYIAWMDTEQNGRINIGQLKTSSSMLSSELKSALKTVSTFKPTGFFITAEDDENVQYPSGQTVLSTGSL